MLDSPVRFSTLHIGMPFGPVEVWQGQEPQASCSVSFQCSDSGLGSTCTRYTFAHESSPTAPDGNGGDDAQAEAATAVLALSGGADESPDAPTAFPAGFCLGPFPPLFSLSPVFALRHLPLSLWALSRRWRYAVQCSSRLGSAPPPGAVHWLVPWPLTPHI